MRWLSLVMLLVTPSLGLAEDAKPRSPFGKLVDAWKAEDASLKTQFAEAPATELEAKRWELRRRYSGLFLDLAKQQPANDSDAWLPSLIWIVQDGVPGPALDEMIDLASDRETDARENLNLQLFFSGLIGADSDRLVPALRKWSKDHPSKGIRGAAMYALGARLKRDGESAGDLNLCREAEEVLDRALTDYPDISTSSGPNSETAAELLKDLRGPLAIGKPAAALRGQLIDGSDFDLSTLKGKVTAVSFSGYWCGPCRRMHPIEKRLMETHRAEDFALVEVNSDKKLEMVRENRQRDGLEWACVFDGSQGPIGTDWNVQAWPTFYVLDRNHIIRHKAVGYLGERLGEWVANLAAE